MSEASAPDEITEDAFLGGALHLRQLKRGHRSGHDAILLAAATPVRAGDRVVEFGAGVGAAGLAVAHRVANLDLTLVEINSRLADLARANAQANKLLARVVELDVGASADAFTKAGLGADGCDVVLMNPPFHQAGRHRTSPDPDRKLAHTDPGDTLEVWCHAARRSLRSGGILTLIWRADGLADVVSVLGKGFGGVEVRPIYPAPGDPAIRIVVRAIKGSRAPLALLPALMLSDSAGQPSIEAAAVLEGRAQL